MPPVPLSLSRSAYGQNYNASPSTMAPEASIMANGNRYHSGGFVVRSTHDIVQSWGEAKEKQSIFGSHSHSASPHARQTANGRLYADTDGRAKSEAYPRDPSPALRGNLSGRPLFTASSHDRPVRDVLTPSFGTYDSRPAAPYPGNATSRRESPAWLESPRFAQPTTHRVPRAAPTPTKQHSHIRSMPSVSERYSRVAQRDPSPPPPKRVFSQPPPTFREKPSSHAPRARSIERDTGSPHTHTHSPTPVRFYGGNTRRASMLWDGSSEYIIEEQAEEDRGKYCVVLDLDETLVFARNGPIQLRPGCKELIRTLGEHCETLVWTAGERSYAKEVLRKIDENGAIRHCVYRHHLWFSGKPGQVKDLRLLGRDPDRLLLIENTPDCIRNNAMQSVLLPDFRGTCRSNALYALNDFIQGLLRSGMPVAQYLRQSPLIAPRQVTTNLGDTICVHTLSNGTDADFQNRVPDPDTTGRTSRY